jgi:hypothetical protein
MNHLIQGSGPIQCILLPEQLGDYMTEENRLQTTDVFVDELDLAALVLAG